MRRPGIRTILVVVGALALHWLMAMSVSSRMGVTDNRETQYAVTGGGGTESVFLNVANNTSNLASLAGVVPDAGNQIVIDIDPGPNNNNGSGFFYLGVLEINSSPVPEPAGMGLLGVAGLALLRRRRA